MTKRAQRGYSLRKQPTEGSWLITVSAGVGKHVTKVVHAPTETKAHRAAQRILPALHERADLLRSSARLTKELNQPGVMTVARLTDQWLQARELEGLTATTLGQYRANSARWVDGLGKRAVVALTPADIDGWLVNLRSKSGHRLTAATCKQILGDLHNCLQWGHKARELPEPATTRATRPRHVTGKREMPELDAFVVAVEGLEAIGSDVCGMALVALGTGLREGEVVGLRWQDVGTKLRVAGAGKRDGTWGETKTRKVRTIPISGICRAGIDIAERLSPDGSPWLWPSPRDPQVFRRPDWLSRQWSTLAPLVGLEGVTFHDLRHAAGSTLLRSGVGLADVSKILGHANVRVTAEVYAHVMGELGDDVMSVLDTGFRRKSE